MPIIPAGVASNIFPAAQQAQQQRAQQPQQGGGGFFGNLAGRVSNATQSPLFGLGVGLLEGSPQLGFQNAAALGQAAEEKKRQAAAQRFAQMDAEQKQRQQDFQNKLNVAKLGIAEKNAMTELEKEASFLPQEDRRKFILQGIQAKRKSGQLADELTLRKFGLDVSKFEADERQRSQENALKRDRLAFDREKEASGGGDRNLTEGERKFAVFGRIAENADSTIIELENSENFNPTLVQPGRINLTRNQDGQKYEAAKRAFIDAIIRPMTGAAVKTEEFNDANKRYFPQFGDDPQTIEFKRAQRKEAIDAIKAGAGASAMQLVGSNISQSPEQPQTAQVNNNDPLGLFE